MKTHEWKTMGRVIYGSRKTAFFEEKKANFAAGLNCTTRRKLRHATERWAMLRVNIEHTIPTLSLRRRDRVTKIEVLT
jgi:hypothetical protein